MNRQDPRKKVRHSPFRTAKNVWFMIRYVLRYAPGYLLVTLLEALGKGGWHVAGVLFTRYLFDAIEAGEDFRRVVTFLLFYAGYNAVFLLFSRWRLSVYLPKVELVLHEGIQNELYEKARKLDQSCYDDPEFYNDFIWAIRESDKRTVQIMENISLFLNRLLSGAVIWSLLASMDLYAALFLLCAVLAGFFVRNRLNRVRYEKKLELNPIARKKSYVGRVFYLSQYAKELRQGKISSLLREKYAGAVEEEISCIKKYVKKIFFLSLLASLLSGVVPSAGMTGYLIFRYILDPTLSLGQFSASIQASHKLFRTLNDLGSCLNKFNEHSLYIENVRRFTGYEPKIQGEIREVPPFESLEIRDLSFTYPFTEGGEPVLSHLNLSIHRGEKIAFVGYNGAGKTTLVTLLLRLYDAESGEILYNGVNIKNYSPEEYRRHIGAVFQDYKIFAATVAENVLGGEYSEEKEPVVKEALEAASFTERLKLLPDGIQTQLTREFQKNGAALSGGEAQKIAIARVFARPFELIVMDEPSSALDPISEYELNQSILKNAAGKTVIFISHRLSTTRMADRIYMFAQGKLVEEGTHGELMEKNGKYAEMFRVQAEKYRAGEEASPKGTPDAESSAVSPAAFPATSPFEQQAASWEGAPEGLRGEYPR